MWRGIVLGFAVLVMGAGIVPHWNYGVVEVDGFEAGPSTELGQGVLYSYSSDAYSITVGAYETPINYEWETQAPLDRGRLVMGRLDLEYGYQDAIGEFVPAYGKLVAVGHHWFRPIQIEISRLDGTGDDAAGLMVVLMVFADALPGTYPLDQWDG